MLPLVSYSVYALCLSAVVLVCALVLFGFFQGLATADLPQVKKTRAGLIASVGLVGWLVLAIELAGAGVFEARGNHLVPLIGVGTGLPIILGLLALRYSTTLQVVLLAIPMHALIGVQLYRVLGGVFLIGLGGGLLPGVFAWPAGVGDIVVGLLAVLVARRVQRHPQGTQRAVWWWSLLGIGDLILAVTLGSLTSPGQLQLLALDAPNIAITAYPFVLVPVFAVPASILLHAVVIFRLKTGAYQGRSSF